MLEEASSDTNRCHFHKHDQLPRVAASPLGTQVCSGENTLLTLLPRYFLRIYRSQACIMTRSGSYCEP